MNRLVFFLAVFGLCAFPAYAQTVHLRGNEADDFIAKNFPNAEIPGEVSGTFTYMKHGYKMVGHAKCSVPAMGARSDGAVSTCTVVY
jgi:hypothetical protein